VELGDQIDLQDDQIDLQDDQIDLQDGGRDKTVACATIMLFHSSDSVPHDFVSRVPRLCVHVGARLLLASVSCWWLLKMSMEARDP